MSHVEEGRGSQCDDGGADGWIGDDLNTEDFGDGPFQVIAE